MSRNPYKLLLEQPEPDFDVLLSRLSKYAFTRLSPRDQQLQMERIRRDVEQGRLSPRDRRLHVEEIRQVEEQGNDESDEALCLRSSFSELLKKLPYSDQLGVFLSNAIKKLKWERPISSFTRLEVDHQKQLLWKSRVHLASIHGRTEEDFRFIIFTELCCSDFHFVHNLLINYSNREDDDEHKAASTFSELLKKIPYSDRLYLFLYEVKQKFKREISSEELISSFERLEVDHQQQLIEETTVHIASMNGETEEDFRLRQFTELYRDDTDYVYDLLINSSNREENEQEATFDDSLDTFGEFFLGFAKIWFEGQSKRSRDLLIEQFSDGVTISNPRPDESEEDFKLRTFTGLCKKVAAGRKVADFRVQAKFLDFAEQKLGSWGRQYSYTKRLIGEPQEFDSAAELLCRLSAIGFSLLSAEHQHQTIEIMINQIESGLAAIDDDDEEVIRVKTFLKLLMSNPLSKNKKKKKMSNQVENRLAVVGESMDEEQDMRVKTFTELFNQFSVPTRIGLFKEFKRMLFDLFLQKRKTDERKNNTNEVPLILILKADEKWGRQGTSESDDEQESPFAKFLFHASVTWFKERSVNYWRNPIPVILFGKKVEISYDIEKLPEENEDDFRLRRFTESFKRLQISSREKIVQYIAERLFRDLGSLESYEVGRYQYPRPKQVEEKKKDDTLYHLYVGYDGREAVSSAPPFASQWIDMMDFPLPQGPPTRPPQVGSATTQAGGGTSQGSP